MRCTDAVTHTARPLRNTDVLTQLPEAGCRIYKQRILRASDPQLLTFSSQATAHTAYSTLDIGPSLKATPKQLKNERYRFFV